MNIRPFFIGIFLSIVLAQSLQAQYFGRNKPNYSTFNFEVVETPHFELYHYLQNQDGVYDFANWTERWYLMHQNVLRDTFTSKNPLILYNDHADFQQTNAISGSIGVGTGGVTEALKNRVILPLAMSNQQTHHVLGHELVHAFQYHMVLGGDSTNLQNLANLPLWMVEGLAEYMSIGREDTHTAMWMRNAVLNDDVPSLKDLDNPKYFPYRYGQAFWAYLTSRYGDEVIKPFFMAVAKVGMDVACPFVLGIKKDSLSKDWVAAVKARFPADKQAKVPGKKLVSSDNAGEMNISPVISPNGRYVIFLSEKNLFSIDIFLADATSGKIIQKVASSAKGGHIDDFNYIESAGTWSPNSQEFAFVAISKGKNIIVVKEALTGKTVKTFDIKGVPAFTNPSWSPDGKSLVVSGLVDGQVDLYQVDIKSGRVTQLTNDKYSEMHPSWTDDGAGILFSSDQMSFEKGGIDGVFTFNLAQLNVTTKAVTSYDVFTGADNLNPVQDSAGNILFLSNRDGMRNLYRYDPADGKVLQLTKLATGITGITQYAPALSLSRGRDRLVYSYFFKNGYSIYKARQQDFEPVEVLPDAVEKSAAVLFDPQENLSNIVGQQLAEPGSLGSLDRTELKEKDYKSKFKLDYIGGSAGVGVGTNNIFGTTTGLAGGIDMVFGDVLGNNQIYTSLALNGEITDFGGMVAYLNRKSRVNYGASLSHIPYRSFQYGGLVLDTTRFEIPAIREDVIINRVFEDKVGLFTHYPFSSTLRVEGGIDFSYYSGRTDRYSDYYEDFGGFIGRYIGQEREKVGTFDAFSLYTGELALVGDNSTFGLTSPLTGHRFRFGVEKYLGEFDFFGLTADYRVYKFYKPVGFAFRAMHYGRYGGNSNNVYPLYVGSPWFIRGFDSNKIQSLLAQNGNSIDQLLGSKLGIANFEVRIPFTGPERLTLIKSGFLFSDLNFFVDGGIAFYDFKQLDGNNTEYLKSLPIFSSGVSLRVNLFGAFIVEPYYAVPLLKNGKGAFGINLIPGW